MEGNAFEIYELMLKRLEKIESFDISDRLTHIENQLKFFSMTFSAMNKCFDKGVKVSISENLGHILEPIKQTLAMVRTEAGVLREVRKELEEYLKDETAEESIVGTIKFMAKRLHELSKDIQSIKENGIKKDVHLALTMDGYEMVKKRAPEIEELVPPADPDKAVTELLKTLEEREKRVLINRYGLFGAEKQTYAGIAKTLGMDKQRASMIDKKAIAKCRTPARRHLVEAITHLELKYAILGKGK